MARARAVLRLYVGMTTLTVGLLNSIIDSVFAIRTCNRACHRANAPELAFWLSPIKSILSFASNGAHFFFYRHRRLRPAHSGYCEPIIPPSEAGFFRHRA